MKRMFYKKRDNEAFQSFKIEKPIIVVEIPQGAELHIGSMKVTSRVQTGNLTMELTIALPVSEYILFSFTMKSHALFTTFRQIARLRSLIMSTMQTMIATRILQKMMDASWKTAKHSLFWFFISCLCLLFLLFFITTVNCIG